MAVFFGVVITALVCGFGVIVILIITGVRFNRHGFGHEQERRSAIWQAQQHADMRAEVNDHWDRIARRKRRWWRDTVDDPEVMRQKEHRILDKIISGEGGKAGGSVHPGHGHTMHGVHRAGHGTSGHKLRLPTTAQPKPRPPKKQGRFSKFVIGEVQPKNKK